MACAHQAGRPCTPSCGNDRFTRIDSMLLARTTARRLVPVANRLRDLYTKFGLRPYKVSIVRTRWSGGRRGVGVELVEGRPFLLEPTPLVSDLTSLAEINTPIGLDEFGEVLVSQVSGCLTEDQLRGHDPEGRPVGVDEQLYYEIEFPPPDGRKDGERRRFTLKGAPFYKADGFSWFVRLERARADRARNGETR